MLNVSRMVAPLGGLRVPALQAVPAALVQQPARGMASSKQLKGRIRAVISVRKITRAMKMVAASKLRNLERKVRVTRAWKNDVLSVWPDPTEIPAEAKRQIMAPVSADRGLCGGVNSAIIRLIRKQLAISVADKKDVGLIMFGDKARGALERVYSPLFVASFTETGKAKPVTFREGMLLADILLSYPYDSVTFTYNRFKNSISYTTLSETALSYALSVKDDDHWKNMNVEGDKLETLQNFYEFRMACRMYGYFVENATSEQSSRMSAMESSTKNAGEMLSKLTLLFNRNRQAKITTELIEIIAGAIASEEQVAK